MDNQRVQVGRIRKIVYVEMDATQVESDGDRCHGYGIIQGADQQDHFFVDSASEEVGFSELSPGQEVCFTLERGPLGRVLRIWARVAEET